MARAPVSGEPLLLVANELRDLRAYKDILTAGPAEVPLEIVGDEPGKRMRVGYSATGFSDNYLYFCLLPKRGGGTWELLATDNVRGKLLLACKRSEDEKLEFSPFKELTELRGVPEMIDWKRDGMHDLLRITSYNVCYTKLLRESP